MQIDLAQAQPMGSLIVEGTHRPFHALACALRPASVRIGRKVTAGCMTIIDSMLLAA